MTTLLRVGTKAGAGGQEMDLSQLCWHLQSTYSVPPAEGPSHGQPPIEDPGTNLLPTAPPKELGFRVLFPYAFLLQDRTTFPPTTPQGPGVN